VRGLQTPTCSECDQSNFALAEAQQPPSPVFLASWTTPSWRVTSRRRHRDCRNRGAGSGRGYCTRYYGARRLHQGRDVRKRSGCWISVYWVLALENVIPSQAPVKIPGSTRITSTRIIGFEVAVQLNSALVPITCIGPAHSCC